MIGKLIFFAACLLAFTEAIGIIDEICSGTDATPQCKEKVTKCFANETPEEAHARLCKHLEVCAHGDPVSKSALVAYLKEYENGEDFCKEKPVDQAAMAQLAVKPYKFFDYFKKVSGPAAASNLACCLGKGSGMFDADGKPNVAAWKEFAKKIVDPACKKAYEAGIDSCAAANPVCNVHHFDRCALRKCYETMDSHH